MFRLYRGQNAYYSEMLFTQTQAALSPALPHGGGGKLPEYFRLLYCLKIISLASPLLYPG